MVESKKGKLLLIFNFNPTVLGPGDTVVGKFMIFLVPELIDKQESTHEIGKRNVI